MNPLLRGHMDVNGYKPQKYKAEHVVVTDGAMGPREVARAWRPGPTIILSAPQLPSAAATPSPGAGQSWLPTSDP